MPIGVLSSYYDVTHKKKVRHKMMPHPLLFLAFTLYYIAKSKNETSRF